MHLDTTTGQCGNVRLTKQYRRVKKGIYSDPVAVIGGTSGVGLSPDHQKHKARTLSVRERTAVQKVILYTHLFKARRDVNEIKGNTNYSLRYKNRQVADIIASIQGINMQHKKLVFELSSQNANNNTSGWHSSSEKEPQGEDQIWIPK